MKQHERQSKQFAKQDKWKEHITNQKETQRHRTSDLYKRITQDQQTKKKQPKDINKDNTNEDKQR